MAVPWLAREAGIFKKHGLEVEVIATPSGVEGMNALIAGEITFLQIAGATTVSAAVGGADVVVIGTTIGTLVQSLMVRPEIEKCRTVARQIRRHQPVRAPPSTPERASRCAISDSCRRKMFQSCRSAPSNPSCLRWREAACKPVFSHIPAIGRARKLGFRELLDIAGLNSSLRVHRHYDPRRGDSKRTGSWCGNI